MRHCPYGRLQTGNRSKMELAVTVSVQIFSPPPLVRWEHFSSSSEEPCCSVPALDRVEERRTIRDRRGREPTESSRPATPRSAPGSTNQRARYWRDRLRSPDRRKTLTTCRYLEGGVYAEKARIVVVGSDFP